MLTNTLIPEMVDPLGKYWTQPSRLNVLVDRAYASMSRNAFSILADYSHSRPTGVYAGKMWKANIDGVWYLKWYGPEKDRRFDILTRELLVDGKAP
ncbi:hypothetical protein NVP1081O_185 [Vibrio phage 1.081.O._10N.286.52.C2]|nr:hypothetical protein NVP1081O_185 [Vibrio phage 1.081.O._10N.286.52.C2]